MLRAGVFGVALWILSHLAMAQDVGVPAPLKAWEPWVMYGEEYRACPIRGIDFSSASGFECRWPGRLRINVSATGGEFSQHWRLYTQDWITLPGNETHWPESVTVDGSAAAVVLDDGVPRIRVGAGEHDVRGRFVWSRRPEALRVMPSTALVDLTIDAKNIVPVGLRDGWLWLGAVRTVNQPRSLQLQVYRLLEDGSPIRLTTQLHLKVSGDAREEVLAKALPDGFVPLASDGPLPFRFEPDGRVRVQVRSGEYVLSIHARASAPSDRFTLPSGEGTWTNDEIWSYRTDDRLRISAIDGAAPIDPVQADVPAEWRNAPAYRLERGASIAIAERSRGLNREDANRLALERDLWLSFDHSSFDAVDRVHGTMQQGWRLDMMKPYHLLNARVEDDTLLITDGADGRTGIEVRTPGLSVTTLSRLDKNGALPATGWDARFESVSTTLHLPPGHLLLAAWGADSSPDAWVNRWKLLDLFLLMLVTAAAYRLLGWGGAAIAFCAIALTHHEPGAPNWVWVNALIAVALARVLATTSLAQRLIQVTNAYRVASLALVAFLFVPFAVDQYRLALHPQLRAEYEGLRRATKLEMPAEAMDAAAPAAVEIPERLMRSAPMPTEAVEAPAQPPPPPKALDRYAPDAMLQTGPGKPEWQFLNYRLGWSGPVDATQTLRLTILSPLLLSLWRIVGVLLSAVLLFALVRIAFGIPRGWSLPTLRRATPVVLLGLLAMTSVPHDVQAQAPDQELLGELKRRLTQPPKCAPNCAQVVLANVDVDRDRLSIELQVHAQAAVALGMPHAEAAWVIDRVTVDDRASDALVRNGHTLELPITPGVHRIVLSGRIVGADELSVEFPASPRRIAIRAEGWDSSGSNEGRLLNNALQLTRRAGTGANGTTLAPQRFPAFVRIHRRVFMNLDWTVQTQVERLAPADGAFTVRLPLLPGEAVLTPGFEVRDDTVLVSMPAGTHVAAWESSLERVDRLQWSAATDQPWVEQWEVVVSPTWHAQFTGTPAILPNQYLDGTWVNEFLPRPGESLDVGIERPKASAGTTLAVDRVWFVSEFAQRLTTTSFNLSYRSSRGGRHEMRIPENARVQSISIDDQTLPLRADKGLLPLTLSPGSHTITVAFTEDAGVGFVSRPPTVNIGADGTNVNTTLSLGEGRWVLFAHGPGVGPAILYWGELAVFIVVALLLGRFSGLPLKTRDWLFLGLGLSTFSWWVLLIFGAWLFVLARRPNWNVDTRWQFNLLQTTLALLSVAAIAVVISAIPYGLLGEPNMGIRPAYPPDSLSWFMDRTGPALTQPFVVSVSIWFYKLAMLLWALWLSFALLRWLPWAWKQFASKGIWRNRNDGLAAADKGA